MTEIAPPQTWTSHRFAASMRASSQGEGAPTSAPQYGLDHNPLFIDHPLQHVAATPAYFSDHTINSRHIAASQESLSPAVPQHWERGERKTRTPLQPGDILQRFSLSPLARHDNRILNRVRLAPRILRGLDFQPAAVLIGLVARPNGIQLILTRRADHLKHHPGQVSFPGGKRETVDCDNIATATREMWEETGIQVGREHIIGELCPLPTVTGYYIHPVLAWVDPQYQPILDDNEVAECFEVPLDTLCQPGHIREQSFYLYGQWHPVAAFYHQNRLIWGATAQLLRALVTQLSLHVSCSR
ncbi:CoA pyrophosphatase [Salinivibrio sp. IB574]|uniref:NUDIX hydrolase n=1 Tax=Salinivibrio sp. IB574 TaxID=1909444 RepID=UPI000988DE3A|nr:CoA pyrophosphatase [Salinivibrio sp. IB574]